MKKEEALEEFGQCLDTIDNLTAAMGLQMPDSLRVKALKGSLPKLKERLKQVYFDLGGEDVWS